MKVKDLTKEMWVGCVNVGNYFFEVYMHKNKYGSTCVDIVEPGDDPGDEALCVSEFIHERVGGWEDEDFDSAVSQLQKIIGWRVLV